MKITTYCFVVCIATLLACQDSPPGALPHTSQATTACPKPELSDDELGHLISTEWASDDNTIVSMDGGGFLHFIHYYNFRPDGTGETRTVAQITLPETTLGSNQVMLEQESVSTADATYEIEGRTLRLSADSGVTKDRFRIDGMSQREFFIKHRSSIDEPDLVSFIDSVYRNAPIKVTNKPDVEQIPKQFSIVFVGEDLLITQTDDEKPAVYVPARNVKPFRLRSLIRYYGARIVEGKPSFAKDEALPE